MLAEIIKATANPNVDNQLLSSAQKQNKSDGTGENDDDDACCYACTKYCRVRHYQKYFDVTTKQVWVRIFKAVVPFSRKPIFDTPRVDLYGPFWIIVTLIIVVAIVAHFAEWVDSLFENSDTKNGPMDI